MEIHACCKFDQETIRALVHCSVYKKFNPQKTIVTRSILAGILLLWIVALILVTGFHTILAVLLAVVLFVVAMDAFMYFILPKKQYKALGKMQNSRQDYVFSENGIKAVFKGQEYTGEAEIEYSLFLKAYETARFIFLYQTKQQVIAVDKETIANGSAEQIETWISGSIKGAYIRCNY